MNERTITVKGIGKVSAKPDLIVISMALENTDYSYSGAMQLASSAVDAIRKALVSVGFEKEALKTTDFGITTDYDRYKDNKGNWKEKFLGYKCTHRLKLEFDFNMELLNKTLTAIASSGSDPRFDIAFSVKDKEVVSEQLLKDAVQNATKKAEILASASGLSLGAVQNIDYNWGELHLYSRTKFCEPMDCIASAPSMAMDIEPEDIDVNDSVTMVWSIV